MLRLTSYGSQRIVAGSAGGKEGRVTTVGTGLGSQHGDLELAHRQARRRRGPGPHSYGLG